MMIVTDGVGSWYPRKGIDAGIFAKDLCGEIMKTFYEFPVIPLKNCLRLAVDKSS